MKKEINKWEQQKEMADVIEQDVLVELKSRRPHKLPGVFVRSALDGKRLPARSKSTKMVCDTNRLWVCRKLAG